MTDIKLSTSGDLDLSTGDLVLLDGLEDAAQRVQITLRFFKGEWFIETTFGIPYFRDVLIKNAQIDVVRTLLIKAIETQPGVDKVTKMVLDLNASSRSLTITELRVLVDGDFVAFENFPIIEL